MSWHEKDGTWSELTWFETTVLFADDIFSYISVVENEYQSAEIVNNEIDSIHEWSEQ